MTITRVLVFGALVFIFTTAVTAQTSAFTYQGKLNVAGVPANGQFDMTFALYDTDVATTPVASNIIVENVQVTNGIFSVELSFDFGPFTSVAGNWLEVRIRPGSETGAFTPLTPRQKINSSPYAMQSAYSVFSTFATSATTAANSSAVGGTPAAQIIKEGDGRLTDARVPLPNSPSYIQNRSVGQTPQTADLNINGSGRVNESLIVALDPNSTLAVGTDAPKTKLHVAGDSTVAGNSYVYGVISGNGAGITNLNGANIVNNSINASALAADSFPAARDLSQAGSLRWDLLTKKITWGGSAGVAVVFDGTNVWALLANGSLIKAKASDGSLQGLYSIGGQAAGAAFDGSNIWITDPAANVVRKIRASDGTNLGNFAVQAGPRSIAFDGTSIWVANTTSLTVSRLRASDGANQGTFPVPESPREIVFDGSNIWVACYFQILMRIRPSDGSTSGPFPIIRDVRGATFDGANLWLGHTYFGQIAKVNAFDPAVSTNVGTGTGSDIGGPVGVRPTAMAFDGSTIWTTGDDASIIRLRTTDLTLIGRYPTVDGASGIAFDGSGVWVVGTNEMRRHPVFPLR